MVWSEYFIQFAPSVLVGRLNAYFLGGFIPLHHAFNDTF